MALPDLRLVLEGGAPPRDRGVPAQRLRGTAGDLSRRAAEDSQSEPGEQHPGGDRARPAPQRTPPARGEADALPVADSASHLAGSHRS